MKRAGDRFRDGTATENDDLVLENWRAAHARVINVFQANLRKRCAPFGYPVGQRLKRRPTIIDKLSREPGMNLARMNDIAGCRVILPRISQLETFRDGLLKAQWRHKLTHEPNRYDYVQSPKETGYRGIHLVYAFAPSSRGADPWRGLRIEIQLRTRAQHLWATGVEAGDLLTRGRAKFGEGGEAYRRYWQLASEIIARTKEGQPSYLADLSGKEIAQEFEALEDQLHIGRLLKSARRARPILKEDRTTILIYKGDQNNPLKAKTFIHLDEAIDYYGKMEKLLGDRADIVLVEANNVANLRKVFQNYFLKTTFFTRYLDEGVALLKP